MYTEKVFYKDSYLTTISAHVISCGTDENGLYVILDKTIAHPKGGGQPSDRGYIELEEERFPILDVVEDDGMVRHYIKTERKIEDFKDKDVILVIDWKYRLRNMQYHTALHILWRSTINVLKNPELVSSAITEKNGYLVFKYEKAISKDELKEIENLTNKVISENRNVKIRWYDPPEYPGWKVDPITNKVRAIEVEDWDITPCGGTHVLHTAEIRLVRVIDLEKMKKGVFKLKILAGNDAIATSLAHEEKYLALRKEVSTDDIVGYLKKITSDLESCKKELLGYQFEFKYNELRTKLDDFKVSGYYVIFEKMDIDPNALRNLTKRLTSEYENMIAVLVTTKPKIVVVGSKSRNIKNEKINMRDIVAEISKKLGGGAGGDKFFATGGGKSIDKVDIALKETRDKITQVIS